MKKLIGYILAVVMVVSIVSTSTSNLKMGGGGLPLTEYNTDKEINGNGNINGSSNNGESGFDVGKTGGIAPLGGTAGSKAVTPKSLALNGDGILTHAKTASGDVRICANGNEIEFRAVGDTEKTNIYVGASKTLYDLSAFGIAGNTADGFDLSGYSIFGGGDTELTFDTKITMTSGKVYYIYGGSYYKDLHGSTYVTINGGTAFSIFGGGESADVATTNITINDGTIESSLFVGGNNGGDITTTNITINGGQLNKSIVAGGSSSKVTTANVTIRGGTIEEDVYGGIWGGGTVETANINISGNPKIGRDDTMDDSKDRGIIINGGTGEYPKTSGVDTFNIVGELGADAKIHVVLPEGYATPNTIAYGNNLVTPGVDKHPISESDFGKVSVVGLGFVPTKMKAKLLAAADNKIEIVPGVRITYDANITTAEDTTFTGVVPVDVTHEAGDTATVLGNVGTIGDKSDVLKRDGFVVTMWNTEANGTGTAYAFGAKITNITAEVKLYAVWGTPATPPSVGGDTTRYYGVSDTTGNGVTPKNEDGKYTYAVDGGNFVLDNIGGLQGGKTFAITVNPNEGYVLDYIMINGEKTTDLTFTMPMKNVDIQVVFKNDTTVVPTPTPSDKPTPGAETAFPWWIVILVGAIVLFIIIIIITKKKKDNEEKHNGGNGNDANQNGNDNELK